MEVEALASILMDDMAVVTGAEAIEGATHAPCYQITISALGDGEEEDPNDESQTARLGLVFFAHPALPRRAPSPQVPQRPRVVRQRARRRARPRDDARPRIARRGVRLRPRLRAQGVDARRAGVVDVVEETPEMLARRLEEEAEARLKAMRAVGTPVTRETYAAWSETFRAERELERLRAAAAERSDRGAAASAKDADEREKGQKEKKMTGRRYFEGEARGAGGGGAGARGKGARGREPRRGRLRLRERRLRRVGGGGRRDPRVHARGRGSEAFRSRGGGGGGGGGGEREGGRIGDRVGEGAGARRPERTEAPRWG